MLDKESIPSVQKIFEKFIFRDILVLQKDLQVTYEFFDVDIIGDHFFEEIFQLRPYFTSTSQQAEKYQDMLFMVAPFFHR